MYNLNLVKCLANTHAEKEAVFQFHANWYNLESDIETKTSGSTGPPKTIKIQKKYMKASALATIDFFGLNKKTTTCLCLNANSIAGKMMLVRVFEANMKLIIAPVSSTFYDNLTDKIDFIALVPMQMQNILSSKKVNLFSRYLIGGAPISSQLENQLLDKSIDCYASFGMTETISHIALRKITAQNKIYKAMPGVYFIQKEDNLVINAKHLGIDNMITTDAVNLINETSFEWLGRSDLAIISGAKKIHPEIIEKLIEPFIQFPFFVFGKKDELLGESLCLILETQDKIDFNTLKSQLSKVLSNHELPRNFYSTIQFEILSNQKIDRIKTVEKLKL